MKLLLDTHVWLWSLRDPGRLGPRLRRELTHPANELWLSPVSVWEALLLHSKKRIWLENDLVAWVRDSTAPFMEACLTHDIVLAAHSLTFAHPDPADRFLAATAQVLGLTLVTADRRLLGLGDVATLGNH